MSTYEANWEVPVLVTAEAVYGIGGFQDDPAMTHGADANDREDEAAD